MRLPIAFAALLAVTTPAAAEVSEIRIAQQFGIAYLPYDVMRDQGLVEKFVKAEGLPEPKVTWAQFSGATAMNEALLSNSIDFATSGVAPTITLWAKTQRNLKVRAVASLGSMPSDLNSNRADIETLKDFKPSDRIAFPAVKVGVQAVLLQMAVEQAFGRGQHERLDSITVSMAHPDAAAALLTGRTEITGHFTTPPFQEQERRDPKIHRVLSSYDILGGPHSLNLVYATGRWADANSRTLAAIVKALDAAMVYINEDFARAAATYIRVEKSNLDPAFVESILRDPRIKFTVTPERVMGFADFQFRNGLIETQPASWKDLFFAPLHDRQGS